MCHTPGEAVLDAEVLRSAPAMLAAAENRMCFVDENTRAMGVRHIKHLF
jgi:hypothetical protein